MSGMTSESPFSWPVRVYYEDTDAQGLVYFANYFKFMERARTEWLRSMNVEQDKLLAEKRAFVVVDTKADFILPAKFNDQLLVTAALIRRQRATFMIEQNIFRGSLDDDLLCRGTTRAAYINTETLKPVRLPDSLFKDSSR